MLSGEARRRVNRRLPRGDTGLFHRGDVSDEAIPASCDRFDETGTRRRVTDGVANPVDRLVHSVIEVHERVGAPQPGPKLLACDDLARPLNQHRQDLKRLFLQPYPHAALPQLSRAKLDFEDAESQPVDGAVFSHRDAR